MYSAKRFNEAGAPPQDQLVGLCWHHVLHADAAIARGRGWQAEFYISALRDHAMELACARLGLPAIYARGVDKLPTEILTTFEAALVRALSTANYGARSRSLPDNICTSYGL